MKRDYVLLQFSISMEIKCKKKKKLDAILGF